MASHHPFTTRRSMLAGAAGLGLVSLGGASAQTAGALEVGGVRWRLRHRRERQASAPLLRAAAPTRLSEARPVSLDKVHFQWPAGQTLTFDDYRRASVLDGFLVLHNGRIVFERYYDGFGPRETHNWASMSKSVIGVLALRMAADRVIDLGAPTARYAPELAGSPFGAATLQQNLDMRAAVAYPKELPPDRGLFAAAGLAPVPAGAPASIHAFLRAVLPAAHPHGSQHYYQNGSTEAVAWALERASGATIPDLVNRHVWTQMGAADDGYYVLDREGVAFTAGGLSSTLRDLARFGEFVRSGAAPGRILTAKDAHHVPGRGFRYSDFWWQGDQGAFALGRYGQRLAVIPRKNLVIAQFGAYEDERPRAVTTEAAAAHRTPDLRDHEAFQALAVAIAALF